MNAIRGGRDGRRSPVWLPALILLTMTLAAPTAGSAADQEAPAVPGAAPAAGAAAEQGTPAASGGGRIREVTVSKNPYYTNIEAVIDGKIENYNSFKLNDPFRIVVDVWGVALGTTAPEIAADTPQVKSIKLSQQDTKVRFLIETPGDRPLPFLVNAEGGKLVLSVGGGQEEKVTSTERAAEGRPLPKGPAVVGIDLEDLPETSNVVVTTAGDVPYNVAKKRGAVEVVFKKASATKDLLRQIDARKFNIPVRTITPGKVRGGVKVTVAFAAGSAYTVDRKDNTVVISFPKKKGALPTSVVATMSGSESPPPAGGGAAGSAAEEGDAQEPRQWCFLAGRTDGPRKCIGQRISLDFKDADLANIFRIIAEVSNLNIITSDDVKGKVSVRLVNVPWDQALEIVLRTKGLSAAMEGNVVRIAPSATFRNEEKARLDSQKELEKARTQIEGEIETIPVDYAEAKDMADAVKDVLSEGGKAQSDRRTNVVMIRDMRKNIDDAKALIRKLDRPTPQVLIEARIVEVDTSYSRELGVQWGGSYRANGRTQFGVTGFQDTVGAQIPGQSLLNTTPFSPGGTPPNWAVNLPAAVGAGSGGGITFGILRDNLRLDLSLSALEASGKGKIISSPKVVTIDNKEATVEQGVQIPYATTSASGTNTTFVDATLSLKVTPHITPGGSVVMKIEAKNDSPGALVGVTGQPAINKKKATTNVLIRDGETAVIGGVLQITRSETQGGVPWLSRIPVLGYLFRKDVNAFATRELLIFVTPKVLKGDVAEARTN